ncbi:MAG: hypothetical protein BroJett040_07620 [Oligoflexia bacterium]|nr:MAG: hypothetical protein BroJett040_07620 [Oligoflexia bacterium]
MKLQILTALLMPLLVSEASSAAAVKCEALFRNIMPSVNRSIERSLSQSWQESVSGLRSITQRVYGRDQVVEALATAILAKEFVWINGEPGGAKTYLSRLMFQSVLNSIPEKDKRIFVLQFHKLINEGKITGFQKFKSMMESGRYEVETSTSLVGDKFLFMIADEAEKSNPAVLNSLLGVLNERKAFLGSRVVDAALSSGVFTSNKTTGEFIQSFLGDRPSGEALLDRMAIKIHMANQQLSPKETVAMYDMVKNPNSVQISLPLTELQALVNKVEIPESMMKQIVSIAREFDRYATSKADQSRAALRYGESESEYFPANQFSTRSVRRLVQVFKASLIAKQLMDGVPYDQIRIVPEGKDLVLLSKSALYVGPSQIQFKKYLLSETKDNKTTGTVTVKSKYGTLAQMQVELSPFENQLRLLDGAGQVQFVLHPSSSGKDWEIRSQSSEFEGWTVEMKDVAALDKRIQQVIADNKLNPEKPQFEVDKTIDLLLAKGTVKKRTRTELESIKADLNQFAEILTRQFEQTNNSKKAKKSAQEEIVPERSRKEVRAFLKQTRSLPADQRTQRYYDWMVYEVRALKNRFIELEHSIEAHLTGLLSENHLYVFGPPGGAKTALAEVILKAELSKMNHDQVNQFVQSTLTVMKKDKNFLNAVLTKMRNEKPQIYKRFLLQFHKLLPEGVLVGFPKIDKQLNEGKEEIETSTSLASKDFTFAILDEVDKANPQTLTALLSILNEREVFHGNEVLKVALRTAILTSNKLPSEFLDSYHEDRSAGEAVMDRTPNKVFVSNKLSTEEAMTQFLMNLEKGISPKWKGLLAMSELKPIVEAVEFESPVVKEMLASIHEKFLALRIKKEEESKEAHQMDAREFPDYYVSATSSASDRTFIKLLDQLKARFIVHQLMNGVAYKDLRTTIEMKDLNLFFEGLGYWAPQKITPTYNQDGILQFNHESAVLDGLISQGVLDKRVKYQVEQMKDEAKDYAQVINTVVSDFIHAYRNEIVKYPELFPSLFANEKSRGNIK